MYSCISGNSAVTGETALFTGTEDCADHFEDSGCDVSSNCIADPLENLPTSTPSECGSNTSISVALSAVHPTLTPCHAFKTDFLVAHMKFLQHILELKELTDSGGLKTDLKKVGIDYSKVSESLSQLVDGLISSYLPEQPFSIFLKQTVFVITKLLSDADLSHQIGGKCFRKLEESIRRLVAIVLNNSKLNRVSKMPSTNSVFVELQYEARIAQILILFVFQNYFDYVRIILSLIPQRK